MSTRPFSAPGAKQARPTRQRSELWIVPLIWVLCLTGCLLFWWLVVAEILS